MTDEEWLSKNVSEGHMTQEHADQWGVLKSRVLACSRCPLHKSCNHKVFGVGNPKAPFLFVGEAPGEKEDLQSEPFVGRTGQYLRKHMAKAGFAFGQVYITNILRCRPPDNRTPTQEEIGHCFLFLYEQMDLIKPKVIVAVGSVALGALCPKTKAIGSVRGEELSGFGFKVVPVWHPSYVLRTHDPLREKELVKDLKKIHGLVYPKEKDNA